MAIKKIAFSNPLQITDILSSEVVQEEKEIATRFQTIVADLRSEQDRLKVGAKIAPTMDDFLYCHAIQMTAAEKNLIDDVTGEFKKNSKGEPVRGSFEAVKDERGRDSVKWVSSDGVALYKNQNADIFPEEDLIKSHKDWVGKPLCKDHVSSTVDGIRGIILDTFYDSKQKQVHALFALDKKNYPELAQKISAQYLTNVSMGTSVGRSICTECANVATIEAEYCHHVRAKSNYGEINKDLKPIELSLVVTGADPRAKIRQVLASYNNYFTKRAEALGDLSGFVERSVESDAMPAKSLSADKITKRLKTLDVGSSEVERLKPYIPNSETELAELDDETLERLADQMRRHNINGHEQLVAMLIDRDLSQNNTDTPDVADVGRPRGTTTQPKVEEHDIGLQDSAGYSLNSEVGKDPTSMVDRVVGDTRVLPDPNSGIATAALRDAEVVRNSKSPQFLNTILNRLSNKEISMNFAELKKRAEARKQAYHQGTEDPENLPYKPMGDADKIRDTQDKQMVGKELDTSSNIPKEDAKVKEMVQRASLEDRRAARAAVFASITRSADEVVKKKDASGQEVMVHMKDDGKAEVLKAKDDKELRAEDGALEDKRAYWQGTEQPTPGKPQYPLMGESHDKMRAKDKHMSGQGMEPGADGMHPGYGESDEAVKKRLQRSASLKAQLTKSAATGESSWKFISGNKEVMTLKASQAYETGLTEPVENTKHLSESGKDLTADEFFKTEAYAKEVMKLIRAAGVQKTAEELGGMLPAPVPAVEAPATPAAPVGAEGDQAKDSKDKVREAFAGVEAALEELKTAVGVEDLKEVDVGVGELDADSPSMAQASFRTQLLKVQAALSEASDELNVLTTAEAPAAVVDEAISDALVVASQASDLLDKVAAKKKKKDDKDKAKDKKEKGDKKLKKKAEDALSELLAARAARREGLVAKAMEHEMPAAVEPVVELSAEDDVGGVSIDELEDLLSQLDEYDTEMHGDVQMADDLCAKDGGDVKGPLNKDEEKEVASIAKDEVKDHEKDLHADDGKAGEDKVEDKKAARKAWRDALLKKVAAGEKLEWNAEYKAARSGPGPKIDVDAKVSDDLNKVETLAEVHQKMEDVARSEPRNVRMAAESIDRLVKAGAIKADQIDELVAKGAVDSDAAKYWREYFGQVDGGKEFATGLTKEFKQAQASLVVKASGEEQEAKLMRAYNLALEAQERNLIPKSRTELHRFASNLVKLPNEQFDAMKNMIGQARKPEHVKTASPVVGLNYDREAPEQAPAQQSDVSVEGLARLFF